MLKVMRKIFKFAQTRRNNNNNNKGVEIGCGWEESGELAYAAAAEYTIE